jgi:DNA-binding HxlR family transcriptional regulator
VKECTSSKPANITLNVIGGKWKPLILWILGKNGPLRFRDLRNILEGVTQKMLTQQLREIEFDKIINRKVFVEVPPKVKYSISSYGQSLIPVLQTMHNWGEQHAQKIK